MSNTKPFTVIKPGDEGFEEINEVVSDRKKYYDYDLLANYYNEAPVGTIIRLENPNPQQPMKDSNVQRVLEGRGLVCTDQGDDVPQDVLVTCPFKDAEGNTIPKEERVVTIKKLTDTNMRLAHDRS